MIVVLEFMRVLVLGGLSMIGEGGSAKVLGAAE